MACTPRAHAARSDDKSGLIVAGSRSYNRKRTPARMAAAVRSMHANAGNATAAPGPATARNASTSADVPLSVSNTSRAENSVAMRVVSSVRATRARPAAAEAPATSERTLTGE
jgi:hypothetical protein